MIIMIIQARFCLATTLPGLDTLCIYEYAPQNFENF